MSGRNRVTYRDGRLHVGTRYEVPRPMILWERLAWHLWGRVPS